MRNPIHFPAGVFTLRGIEVRSAMRLHGVMSVCAALAITCGVSPIVEAQAPEPTTREAALQQEQAEKAKGLKPFVPNKIERLMDRFDNILANGTTGWHVFLENAYAGGGFAIGPGYTHHFNGYNFVDVRGSYSIKEYKLAEAEFVAPRMFHRRARVTVLGGWREATEVGFYGLGTNTPQDARANFSFEQPYVSTTFTIAPTRRYLVLGAGVEWSRWAQGPGRGSAPSVEDVYTPETLPGLGSDPTYRHSQGSVGFDWRTSRGYARRGGFYGVAVHDYNDRDDGFGFERVDYEAIQHVPILREAWVISLRGRVQTAFNKSGQQIPFFMLPYVGGGHTLRGYSSTRFRDTNGLLVQAEGVGSHS